MNKRGYFGGFTGTLNGFALQPAMLRTSAHKRSNDKEADELAIWAWQIRVLQKASAWEALKDYSSDEIAKFAKENSISPCIVAGRVRHESGVHKTFGSLYRDKVRAFFE